jgi:hypothetical protein
MTRILANLGHQILQRFWGALEPLEIEATAVHEKPGNAMNSVIAPRHRYDLSKGLSVEIRIAAATVRDAVQHLPSKDWGEI